MATLDAAAGSAKYSVVANAQHTLERNGGLRETGNGK